jgi:probable HAF family extracellular repeat protein
MKYRTLMFVTALATITLLAIPAGLSAQDKQDSSHHHYQLVDLGTFGGPQSWVFGWEVIPSSMSDNGGVMGEADTPSSNPNYPNFNPFMGLPNTGNPLTSDPYIQHAFQSKDGALIDLGVLPGGYNSSADWISSNGIVVGASENGVIDPPVGWPEVRAVIWEGGQPNDLGTFGGNESVALGVNNRKQVVGMASNTIPDLFSGFGTQGRAFLWQEGAMQDLGLLGTGTFAIATNINEQGQIVGGALTNTSINPNTGFPQQDSFFWEDNGKGMQDIPTLGGGISIPNAINNQGQVAGQSDTPGDVPGTEHGFYWDKQRGTVDLGTLGGRFSDAEWINDAGDIVGAASGPNDRFFHAVLWVKLKIHDLGTLAGSSCSRALSIYSLGQIVGYECGGEYDHALIWDNGGAAVALDTLIPAGSSLHLMMATSINDRGEIGGQGVTSAGDNHAFLLIPCDENHPAIEGCDYSPVDESAQTSAPPVLNEPVMASPYPRVWKRNNHFRFSTPRN